MTERFLRSGESARGRAVLLFAYLFLVLFSYVTGKVVRDALFLDQFKAVQLPYADIASALLVGFVIAGYVRISRRLSLARLLMASLVVYVACCVTFYSLAQAGNVRWLYSAIYLWVGVFGVVATAQVWTFANFVMTTREAKQYFAVIGAGAICGAICSGFLTKRIVLAFGTHSLLLAMAAALLACVVLVWLISRSKQESQPAVVDSQSEQRSKMELLEGFKQILGSSHLRAIAAVIWLSSFVTAIVGWQFKSIAKQHIPNTDALATFFGDFNFYSGLASLAAQLLLTSKLLKRFGVGPALMILPIALSTGSIAVATLGTLAAIIFLRGSDQVLRYSVDKSSVELLYLPVPSGLKIQAKGFIDTVIWRVGDLLSGVAVLLFANYLRLAAPQLSWVSLVLLCAWIAAAIAARRTYVGLLREGIRNHRLETERTEALLDSSATETLIEDVESLDEQEIVYRLKLLRSQRSPIAPPPVRSLLDHASPLVRREALGLLATSKDATVQQRAKELLHDPNLEVRTEALLYLTLVVESDPMSVLKDSSAGDDLALRTALVAFLAKPGPSENIEAARLVLDLMLKDNTEVRTEAARLLGSLPNHFDRQLRKLLHDDNSEVVLQAISSVCRARVRKLVPDLLEKLQDPRYAEETRLALEAFQDSSVGMLRDHMRDVEVDPAVRRQLPGIMARIRTQSSVHILQESLLSDDPELRFEIIAALNKLRRDRSDLRLNNKLIETALASEIAEHYGSYQTLSELTGGPSDGDYTRLQSDMSMELERIFRLLNLLYPQYDLHSAHVGVISPLAGVRDNALELLDNILNVHVRNLLVPLLDDHVSVAERARIGLKYFGKVLSNRLDITLALVHSDDPWVKASGAYAIGFLDLYNYADELQSCCTSAVPEVREAGQEAYRKLGESHALSAVAAAS
jgi:ATP:ADP antiporter, AAA family